MLSPDQKEGGFQLEAMLGEDQLAATWKVTELATGKPRVLRILTVRSPPFQERFTRAAKAQLQVVHPNLVQVVGVTEFGERPAVVTEFVDGVNLATWISQGPHSVETILGVFAGLVRGVGAAHAAGLLHRNLKPSKVLVDRSEVVPVPKVNDFTLGKVTVSEGQALTQVGITFGTPHYMAPEQFRGVGDVDPRADLFALGCILYEVLAGRRAFEGTDLMDLYRAVSGSRYAPLVSLRPDVPPAVVKLVEVLLAPDAAARPQSAQAVLELMRGDAVLAALVPAPPEPTPPLKPAGPTLVAGSAVPSAIPEPEPAPKAPPAQPAPAARAAPAEPPVRPQRAVKTAELPLKKGKTLPPESVFVKDDDAAAEKVLRRQIGLASVVAIAFALLAATLLWALTNP